MRTSLPLALAGALAGSWLLAGPAGAVPCDAYSGGCPSPPAGIGGNTNQPGTGGNTNQPGTGGNTNQPGTGGNTDQPGTDAGDATTPVRARTTPNSGGPATLPFTGGELVMLTTVGLGAVAGGTVLVVAGRRRREPAAQ